jgi:response regulator of citrate/malate metabolism
MSLLPFSVTISNYFLAELTTEEKSYHFVWKVTLETNMFEESALSVFHTVTHNSMSLQFDTFIRVVTSEKVCNKWAETKEQAENCVVSRCTHQEWLRNTSIKHFSPNQYNFGKTGEDCIHYQWRADGWR